MAAGRSRPAGEAAPHREAFERLRDEHGFTGGYTIVKDYLREHRRRGRAPRLPGSDSAATTSASQTPARAGPITWFRRIDAEDQWAGRRGTRAP